MAHSRLIVRFLSTLFLAMFCVSPPQANESSLANPPKPLLSLPLYHVEYFERSSKDNYFHVFSRLMARDKARQEYLAYVYNQNLGPNFTKSEFDESSTTLYMEKNGLYVVGLKVGSTGQILYLLLDTGSSIVWWQCQPCRRCFESDHPMFDPKLSSSFRWVSCEDKECADDSPFIEQNCDDYALDECYFHVRYQDRDRVEGALARDEVTTMNDEKFERDLIFGCARQAVGQHYSGYYSGILGFNQDLYSFPARMRINQFSLCYSTPHSNKSTPLYLGQIPTFGDKKVIKAQMILEGDGLHYYVKFSGIKVGLAETISMDPEQWWYRVDRAIIDTGTLITRFPDSIYREFRDSFRRQSLITHLDEDDTHEPYDTCYMLSNPKSVDLFPKISLVFNDDEEQDLELEPRQTMMEVPSVLNSNVYCLAFSGQGLPDSIIGTWQLQQTRVNFDVMTKTLSLVTEECN